MHRLSPTIAPAVRVAGRVIVAVPLGYALVALCVSALAAGAARAGMDRADAVVLSTMLGFVAYLMWLLWAFVERSLLRVYAAAGLGSLAAAVALWLFAVFGRA